ncbi:hypothetical protein CRG98_033675 [Punica granatum]|uniref:Uncharacterized protein n=1 Tax=Punica granatum TaxID=22663 RepID=A0A2I0IR08_PUNGR|nr:hypothetical protein CRG98_033675 [Punica granatum]
MPPRRRDRVDDVLERDNLRHLEQRMEQINRENPNPNPNSNPNPNPNPEQEESGEESEGENYSVEYDSYSEEDVNIFIEEGPSDDAFFLAGGDGEPEVDEDVEGYDKGYDENWNSMNLREMMWVSLLLRSMMRMTRRLMRSGRPSTRGWTRKENIGGRRG